VSEATNATLNTDDSAERTEASAIAQADAGLSELQKQLARFGREQFKLNTLVEAQQRQVQAALEQLREHDERRERDVAHARLDVVKSLLPVLDGLDEALSSLDRIQPSLTRPQPFWRRLFGSGQTTPPAQALDAWGEGLRIVRDRLLHVLAREDVQPVKAIGEPFNPDMHVALGNVPASGDHPSGTIVSEVRRGYTAGSEMLRYAEVVVAK
jgi:molecular chaperone GrpE